MTQLERLKDELITLTVRRGYPAELGALMAAELGTERDISFFSFHLPRRGLSAHRSDWKPYPQLSFMP